MSDEPKSRSSENRVRCMMGGLLEGNLGGNLRINYNLLCFALHSGVKMAVIRYVTN